MMEMKAIFVWLLSVELLGLLALPIASHLCRCLPDRGYSASKPLGVLLLTYFTWLPVSLRLIRFGQISIMLALSILFLLSALVMIQKRPLKKFADLRKNALKAELVFLSAFFAMALILSNKPDILAQHSEDFMDYAFLRSILRSEYFPPPDPWLAGETLSYYYFGQLEVAILTISTKIPSNITYNLTVATFFGLTACIAYGLGSSLTGKSFYGVLAAFLVAVSGILSGFLQLLVYLAPRTREFIHYTPLASSSLLQWLHDFDFWNSISVIPETFDFYPYHTFVHGYLHAHMISIPFQLMFLALCLSLIKERQGFSGSLFLLTALSLGFFAGLNIWDYPAYFLVLCLVLFIKAHVKYADTGRSLIHVIKVGGAVALISIILYIPYYEARDSGGFQGLRFVGQRTELFDFLEVFGLFIFIILTFLLIYGIENRKRMSFVEYTAYAVILIPVLVIARLWDFQLLPILAAIILLAAYWAVKLRGRDEEGFSFLLIAAGGAFALIPEILYAADAMPWPRFNTVMKLYLQVWVLWGIASAYALYYIHQRMKNKSRFTRSAYPVWAAFLILLFFASLVHPIASTVSWTSGAGASMFGSFEKDTLDGTRYLNKMHPGDYKAIQWIDKNIEGSPTILEAPGVAYQYSSVIATITGMPTVLGWKSHEITWNNNWSKIEEREIDINRIYSTKDINESLRLLKKYDVQYVYIGENELSRYKTGLDKFQDERYFERAYREYTELYKVKYIDQ